MKMRNELLWHPCNDFLTILLGGRLSETENKRICQIFGLKSGRGRLQNLSSARLREFLKQYLTEKQNSYLQSGRLREVVTYEKWSLGESWLYVGRLCLKGVPFSGWKCIKG